MDFLTANERHVRFVGQEPGALPLCLALARAGCEVMLVDADPYDRKRVSDMLPRWLGSGAHNLDLIARPPEGAIRLSADPSAEISLDWTVRTDGPKLCYRAGVQGRALIEQLGADPSGVIARVAEALSVRHVILPASTVPISARFHAALGRALEEALLTSGTPDELDQALTQVGFEIGPFALQDQIGIDVLLTERQVLEARSGLAPLPLFPRAVAEGRLGQKASVGWHRYPGQGGAVEDPLVEDMAEEEARFAGWPRVFVDSSYTAQHIAARMDRLAETLTQEGVAAPEAVAEIAQMSIGYAPRPAIRPKTTAASSPLPDR